MALAFAAIDSTSLDSIETSIGVAPQLLFFSGPAAGDCDAPNPPGLLVTVELPTDWMNNESGGTKTKLGPWEGVSQAAGTIASFRLIGATRCHMEGTVTATGGGGDFTLNRVNIGLLQRLRVDTFTLSFAAAAQQVVGSLSRIQANNTLTAFGTVQAPAQPSLDVWSRLDGNYPNGDPRAGPFISSGHYSIAVSSITGKVWLCWGHPSSGVNHGNFLFDPANGQWARTNSVSGEWLKTIGLRENYDASYDKDRDVIWIGSGAPVSFGQNESPQYGEMQYDFATDIFSTPWPDATNTYVPDAAHAPYFGSTTKTSVGAAQSVKAYYRDKIYTFGGFTVGESQALKRRFLPSGSVNPIATAASGPTWSTQPAKYTMYRGGVDSRNGMIWSFDDDFDFWVYYVNDSNPAWIERTTTGTKPSTPLPGGEIAGTQWGVMAELDEAGNCIVCWVAQNVLTQQTPTTIRKTWVLDLATLAWRDGPSAAVDGTNAVPPGDMPQALNFLCYDPLGRRTILTSDVDNVRTQVWAFKRSATGLGTLYAHPLPLASGSVYGVNYHLFPYTRNIASKHTNMAYCPLNNRIYVSGGDVGSSVTDGMWSMDCASFEWRLDYGRPVFPDRAAPNAFQDTAGFAWMPSRNKFVMWPGSYFGGSIATWARGYWFFDPLTPDPAFPGSTGTWTQFLDGPAAWNTMPAGGGVLHGGIYDEQNDDLVWFNSGTPSFATYFNLTTKAVTSYQFTVAGSGVPQYTGLAFSRPRHAKVDRNVYVIGYFHNGISTIPALWRWNLDTHVFTEMARPPAAATVPSNNGDQYIEIAPSGNKIVWPWNAGPEGVMAPKGVFIYNIATNSWSQDAQVPGFGNYLNNAVGYIPDGRVLWSGGVFGPQQTHMWVYTPAP